MPMVIDHMGRVKAADGLEQEPFKVLLSFMRNPNTWVKVCGAERVSSGGPPFQDAVPFARALIEAAPERILWGTDWPHPNVGRHCRTTATSWISSRSWRRIRRSSRRSSSTTPARLYGFR